MATCPYCGAQIPDNMKFCGNCGAPAPEPQQMQNTFEPGSHAQGYAGQNNQPAYQQNSYNRQNSYNQQQMGNNYGNSYNNAQYNFGAPVASYPTGGLIVWSIITILLCTIPGIIALIQTLGINKAMTQEEQQRKIKSARTWCIVGTILGILFVIGSMAQARII